MKFTKELKAANMKLTGKKLQMGKFTGDGYELSVGNAKVDLCGIGRGMLGIELQDGEDIKITKIIMEFES